MLDPHEVRDLDTAFKLFDALRSHFEEVASRRHMNGDEYDGEHEGQPNDIAPGNEFKRALGCSGKSPTSSVTTISPGRYFFTVPKWLVSH
jgi:hypothetical protein